MTSSASSRRSFVAHDVHMILHALKQAAPVAFSRHEASGRNRCSKKHGSMGWNDRQAAHARYKKASVKEALLIYGAGDGIRTREW